MPPSPTHSEANRPSSSKDANFSFFKVLPWIIAAGSIAAFLWVGLRQQALRAENEVLQTRQAAAELARRVIDAQLQERTLIAEEMINHLGASLRQTGNPLLFKVAHLAPTLANLPLAQGSAIWDPATSTGLLLASGLPAVGPDQNYQVWLTDLNEDHTVSGGVFQPDFAGRATVVFTGGQPIAESTVFAVSLEKKDSAGARAGPTVLQSQK